MNDSDDDDWDYAVPAARSWDCEMDPVASARETAAQSVFPADHFSWSQLCFAPTRSACLAPRCRNELVSDETYYTIARASSIEEPREQQEEEKRDSVPASLEHATRNIVVDDLPLELIRKARSEESPSVYSETSSCYSSEPPPPPPRSLSHDDSSVQHDLVDELYRQVSALKRLASGGNMTEGMPLIDLLTAAPKLHPRSSSKRVRFANPIVTSLKFRPTTLPEEISQLYFDEDELAQLEQEREEHDTSFDFEVAVVEREDHNTGTVVSNSTGPTLFQDLPWQVD